MTVAVDYNKPLPVVDEASRPFWDAAREGRFLLYRCGRCATHYYPATLCTTCDASPDAMSWELASGRGTLFTWTVFHRSYHPGFADDLPYNVAIVQLDEGPFFMTNVVGCRNDDLRTGMDLEVTFEAVTDTVTLPKFRPVRPTP